MPKQVKKTTKKKPVNTGKKQEGRNDKGQFVKGVSGNPEGKPEGTVGFKTMFDQTLKEIAKLNKIKEPEAFQILFKQAYLQAKQGNFNYFKDIMDRYYGKPVQSLELGGPDGEPIQIEGFNYAIPKTNDTTPAKAAPSVGKITG